MMDVNVSFADLQDQNIQQSSKERPKKTARPSISTKKKMRRIQTIDFDHKKKLEKAGSCLRRLMINLKHAQNSLYLILEDETDSTVGLAIQYALQVCIALQCVDLIVLSVVEDQENDNYTTYSKHLNLTLFIIFCLEYVIRACCSTALGRKFSNFLGSPQNIIDLVAILPYFIEVYFESQRFSSLRVVRSVRFFRVFRLFKFSRYMKGMQMLTQALTNALTDLLMLICLFIFSGLIFSMLLYHAETSFSDHLDYMDDATSISTFPDAIWCCIVTMTTVGYGDKLPVTIAGKFVAAVSAIFGISTISLPVAIMGNMLSKALQQQEETKHIQNIKQSQQFIAHHATSLSSQNVELEFMEMRLEALHQRNQSIVDLVYKSQALFDEVTGQLKSIYRALASEIDLQGHANLKQMNREQQIVTIQKVQKQQKNLDLKLLVSQMKVYQREEAQSRLQESESYLNIENDLFISPINRRNKNNRVRASALAQLTTNMQIPTLPYQLHQVVLSDHSRPGDLMEDNVINDEWEQASSSIQGSMSAIENCGSLSDDKSGDVQGKMQDLRNYRQACISSNNFDSGGSSNQNKLT